MTIQRILNISLFRLPVVDHTLMYARLLTSYDSRRPTARPPRPLNGGGDGHVLSGLREAQTRFPPRMTDKSINDTWTLDLPWRPMTRRPE